ncbi:MAG: energy-coupling factor ABC transporter ATP-binding protein [Promethearchaeota archaeon]
MIEFRSVTYRYPDGPRALDGVSLRIEPGSFVAIMGKNGAGKTTLVKCMNGLIKPSSGDVLVNGVCTRDTSVARLARNVGLVFQNPDTQLFSTSLKEELAFSLRNIGVKESEQDRIIDENLKRLNLLEFKGRSPFLLSGGERKRAAFAALICMDPEILIADEPTQGQDGLQKQNLERILKDLQDKGRTVIIVSHDVDFVTRLADRVIVMDEGRILVDGKVEDVFRSRELLEIERLVPTQELELKWALSNFLSIQGAVDMKCEEFFDAVVREVKQEGGGE